MKLVHWYPNERAFTIILIDENGNSVKAFGRFSGDYFSNFDFNKEVRPTKKIVHLSKSSLLIHHKFSWETN